MTGTVNQVDWAQQIKAGAGAEFDRVANALESTAASRTGDRRGSAVANGFEAKVAI